MLPPRLQLKAPTVTPRRQPDEVVVAEAVVVVGVLGEVQEQL